MVQDPFLGRVISEFEVIERLGRGGMATVYRARQQSVNRDVALKIIELHEDDQSEEFRRRFKQEAEVIASLEHIHILPIYSYGIAEEDDIAYLAMRLLRGGSLNDILRHGAMEVPRAVQLFGEFARGLAHAHSKGVIHRDLKPSNILLDDNGHAYLTDFGLAKLTEGDSNLTKTGNVVGTPAYMSPEQLRGEVLDHRSDIYSAGVMLYHMLTGQAPFGGSSSDVVAVIYSHLEKMPEPPSTINPEVPPLLDAVVMRAMAKDPNERYDNIGDMAREAKAAVGLSVSTTSYPAVAPTLAQRRAHISSFKSLAGQGRSRIWGYLFVVVAIAIIAGALIALSNIETPIPAPTVLTGEVGTAEDAIPTSEELANARRKLGDDGFIAYIACTQDSEYHARQIREMRDFATNYNLNFRVYDSEADEYNQLTQIERARTDGAAGLIICILNEELLSESLSDAQAAGIPMVFFGDPPNKFGGVALSSRNVDYQMGLIVGEYAGEYINEHMDGQADVIILDFPDLEIIVQRANGLEEGVLSVAPDVNIIGRYLGALRDNGYNTVKNLLDDGVEFNVILSINDAGAFGAVEALEEANIGPDEVHIFSVDAEQLARQYIRDDYYFVASLGLDASRRQGAQDAINAMAKLLGGGTIPEQIEQIVGAMVDKSTLLNEAEASAEPEAEATEAATSDE